MPTSQDLYNQDFYTWAMTTAKFMRQKQWHEIDWEAVIEEIEGLARRDKRELASRLETLGEPPERCGLRIVRCCA